MSKCNINEILCILKRKKKRKGILPCTIKDTIQFYFNVFRKEKRLREVKYKLVLQYITNERKVI